MSIPSAGYQGTMVIASIDTVDTLLRYRTIIDIDLCRTRVSIPVLRQRRDPGKSATSVTLTVTACSALR